MTAADRLAQIEAERWAPVPRKVAKPAGPQPVSPQEQARHRADLLAAVYGKPRDDDFAHDALKNAA